MLDKAKVDALLAGGKGPPGRGYGDHSCQACVIQYRCPLKPFIKNEAIPNGCSYYWPLSYATQKPSQEFLEARQRSTDGQ